MWKWAGFGAWSVAVVLTLSGCGGGGGGAVGGGDGAGSTGVPGAGTGGSGTAGNGSASGPTLKFTSSNAGRVTGYPLWASEGLMRLGSALSDDVVTTIAQKKATDTGACQGNGTWSRTFQDNDGNGVVSAGDVIVMQFTGCHRNPLASTVDGVASVKVVSVDSSGGFVAEATMQAPGIAISATVGEKNPDFRMSGKARLELSISDTRRTLAVGDGTSNEVVFDFPWMSLAGDRVSSFRMVKSQHWDEARSHLDLQMRYTSPELGGSFDVSTPVSITSWLDTLPDPRPDQGWLLMKGAANDQARIDVIGTGGSSKEIGVKVDLGGNGTVDLTGVALWTDAGLISGFFFADYTPGGLGNTYGFDPNEFSLRGTFRASTTVAVKDALRVQFTRPPADADSWKWRLVDKGASPGGTGLTQEVPVTVQTIGALVLIKPVQALRYSRHYELTVDTGTPAPQGQLLRAATGGTINLYQGIVGNFETLDYLNPRPNFFQQPIFLTPTQGTRIGTFAQANGAPPVTYRWEQISGPPVTIATPSEVETNISLGAGARGIGSATLRLTMTLADGTSASEDLVIRTMHDSAQQWASVVHVPALGSSAVERFIWGGPEVGKLQLSGSGDRLSVTYSDTAGPIFLYPDWSVQLRSGDGSPLRPGKYTNAWSPANTAAPAGANQLAFDMQHIGFVPWGSDFTILELETDGAGTITKLALDFVVRGIGDYTPINGSVRWNSSLPLAP